MRRGKKEKVIRERKGNHEKLFERVILNRAENLDDRKIVRYQATFDRETNFNSITLKVISQIVLCQE